MQVDPDLLARPYLRPLYDEPEFVIRNVWRQYGGWWDGDAAPLKPAPAAALAAELAALAGGAARLARAGAERWRPTATCAWPATSPSWPGGQHPPTRRSTRSAQLDLPQRRSVERSLMAKGIYAAAARESEAIAGEQVRR